MLVRMCAPRLHPPPHPPTPGPSLLHPSPPPPAPPLSPPFPPFPPASNLLASALCFVTLRIKGALFLELTQTLKSQCPSILIRLYKERALFENICLLFAHRLLLFALNCQLRCTQPRVHLRDSCVMLAHTHACTHARMHTRTHAHKHACTHARMHTRTHAHTHACTQARMHTRTHAHTYACTHVRMHTRTHAHTYVCTRKHPPVRE
jgi:hypothetical protein